MSDPAISAKHPGWCNAVCAATPQSEAKIAAPPCYRRHSIKLRNARVVVHTYPDRPDHIDVHLRRLEDRRTRTIVYARFGVSLNGAEALLVALREALRSNARDKQTEAQP